MLKDFTDIAPKAALAAALLWSGSHYLLIGPDVAARVVRADYLPQCEDQYQVMVARAGEARASAVPLPQENTQQDMAAAQLGVLWSSPFMQELQALGGGGDMLGLGAMTDIAVGQFQAQKQAARDAYDAAIAQVHAQTATDMARSGTVCGCIADAAIGEARTEWAVYSGSLGLFQPAPVREFDQRMMQAFETASCGIGGRS